MISYCCDTIYNKYDNIMYMIEKRENKIMQNSEKEIDDSSIFMLQTICIGTEKFNIFFDTGYRDLVSSKNSAIKKLERMGKATLDSGLGNHQTLCEGSIFKVVVRM